MYSPGAIVLQCGADSLAGDRLGCFNLSIDGAPLLYSNISIGSQIYESTFSTFLKLSCSNPCLICSSCLTGHAECVQIVKKFNLPLLVGLSLNCFKVKGFVINVTQRKWLYFAGNWGWRIHKGECC